MLQLLFNLGKKSKINKLKLIFNQFFISKTYANNLSIFPLIWTGIYKKFFYKKYIKNFSNFLFNG